MRRKRHKPNPISPASKKLNKWKLIGDAALLTVMISIVSTAVIFGKWKDADNQEVNYQLEIGLAGGFIVFAFLLWKILSLYLNANEYSERKDFVDLHAKILGSVALVVSLLFTWQGIKTTQKTSEENQQIAIKNQMLTLQSLENAERKQIEDRYNSALQQLGSKEREARLGAIYSLGKIAIDSIEFSKKNQNSRDFYWEIMQTLASYVRGNAPVTKISERSSKAMPTDIQAALSVLAWRSRSYKNGEEQPLELYNTDLRGLILKDKDPEEGTFNRKGGNFEGAQLTGTNFENANLRGIKFKKAILKNAVFTNAYLAGSDFTGADLACADLTNADLGNATVTPKQILSAKNWKKARTLPPNVTAVTDKETESPAQCKNVNIEN